MASAEPDRRSWDLSLYELHRTPQEVITDDTEIAVSARSLQSELTCPICLDMLTNTMTTKDCLHRFCAECIVTALRSGNKECPTCRKKLVSRRSLRADPNFDKLVEKIFPNRDEYEAHQESILETLSRSHSQNFITSFTHGIKAQMAHAKAATKKSRNEDGDDGLGGGPDSPTNTPITGDPARHDDDYEAEVATPPPKKKKKLKPPTAIGSSVGDDASESAGPSGSGFGQSAEVEIVFKLHPSMKADKDLSSSMDKQNATRYIKTTSKALVEHLCKYLAMRIALDMEKKKNNSDPGTSSTSSAGTSSGGGGGEVGQGVKDLSIYINSSSAGGATVTLAPSLSLTEVSETHWKVNKPMEMLYSFKRV